MISVDSLRNLRASVGDDETRLLMVGLPGSGKTTILSKISKRDGKLHDMGNQKFRVRNLVVEGLSITVWDVGDDCYVDPYWADYHAERVVGIIFVVDSAEPSKFVDAKTSLFKSLASEKLARVPVLIMCNKGDIEGASSVVKVSEALELHDMKGHPHKSVRTSAVTDEGIQAGLEWLVSQKFVRT
jgi:small GTP-binding protein